MARGLIFKTDTYIPMDAVAKRIGTDVFINIPKLVVGTMPWASLRHERIGGRSTALAPRRWTSFTARALRPSGADIAKPFVAAASTAPNPRFRPRQPGKVLTVSRPLR